MELNHRLTVKTVALALSYEGRNSVFSSWAELDMNQHCTIVSQSYLDDPPLAEVLGVDPIGQVPELLAGLHACGNLHKLSD